MADATPQTQAPTITVPIDDSRHARSFNPDASFYAAELARTVGIIEDDLAAIPDARKQSEREVEDTMLNVRDVICVYGARGAGKTSFLRSVEKRLGDNREVHVLRLLDPTLIERNEVFLATIVSNVLAAIEERSRPGGVHRPYADHALAHDERLREALDALARAFRLLAPGGLGSSWGGAMADPHLFAHEVLQDAASGRQLAVRFHRFIAEAARVVEVKAFIQPLDDVDTAYEQGWHVLETTRKYLSTRLFIPMISGDLELYRMLVRARQLDNVRTILDFEQRVAREGDPRADLQRYRRQVDQLEEQYLLKVMPAERRVRLRAVRERIWQAAREGRELIRLQSKRFKDGTRDLSAVFEQYCRDVFGWRRHDEARATLDPEQWPVARLLPARTRSLIALFEEMASWTADAPGRVPERPAFAVEGLARIFRQALATRDVDDDLLDALAQGLGLGRLGAWVLRWRGEVSQLHLLDPERLRDLDDAEEWTQTVLTLNGALYQHWQRNPGGALRYAIKVVLPALQAGTYGAQVSATSQKLAERIALEANEPTYLTATRLQACRLDQANDLRNPVAGLVWLPRGGVKGQLERVKKERVRFMHARGMLNGRSSTQKQAAQDADIDLIPLFKVLRESQDTETNVISMSWSPFRRAADPNILFLLDWFTLSVARTGNSQLSYLSAARGIAALGDLLDSFINDTDSAIRPSTDSIASARASTRDLIGQILRDYDAFAPMLGAADKTPVADERKPGGASTPQDGTDDSDASGEEEHSTSKKTQGEGEATLVKHCLDWGAAVRELAQEEAGLRYLSLPPLSWARTIEAWWRNVEKIHADVEYRTVGGMLHRWMAAFLHHHLIAEVQLVGDTTLGFNLNAQAVVLQTDSFDKNLASVQNRASADIPATALWMSCPIVLLCLAPSLRKRVAAVAKRSLGSVSRPGGAMASYLAALMSDDAMASGWLIGMQCDLAGMRGDIHTLLTAFVSPRHPEPSDPSQDVMSRAKTEFNALLSHQRDTTNSSDPRTSGR